MRYLLTILLLVSYTSAYAVNYTVDADCQQSFVLDSGDQDVSDRTGSNDLVLTNGTWAGSNIGYTFDADATGAFTPTLTTWQGKQITIALLSTVDNVESSIILNAYASGDTARRYRVTSNAFAAYTRAQFTLGRQYNLNSFRACFNDANANKQWIFSEYDNATSSVTMYRDGTKNVLGIAGDNTEYGTMTCDTGQLGNGSGHTIYQVAIFDRLLDTTEMSDITTNGLLGGEAPAAVIRRKTSHIYGGIIE